MLGALGVNVPSSEGCVTFALAVSVSAAILVVLDTLAVVIFAFPLMSSEALVSVAETPVNAGRLTPPENTTEPSMACADTEAGVTPMVYLVSSAENGVSDTAAKPNIYNSASTISFAPARTIHHIAAPAAAGELPLCALVQYTLILA